MSTYSFVSCSQDVDFMRMIVESPKGTLFILAETKTKRGNKPLAWALLINLDSLIVSQRVREKHVKTLMTAAILSGFSSYSVTEVLKDNDDRLVNEEPRNYLLAVGQSRFPKHLKLAIDQINADLNSKDVVTEVTYL